MLVRHSLRRCLQLQAAEARSPPRWRPYSSNSPPPQTPPTSAPGAAAKEGDAAAAATSARATAEAKLGNELNGLLFPWERGIFGDRTEKLAWWQKAYWVGFACVFTYWLGEKSYNKVTTGKWHGDAPLPPSAPKPKPKPTLLKSRVNDALGGRSFVEDDDDPFEGLSPEEIQRMVAKEAPSGDAFEGMTPEEINTYLQRERAEREGTPLPPAQGAAAHA